LLFCGGIIVALVVGWSFQPPFEHQASFSNSPVPEGMTQWSYTTGIGLGGRKEFGVVAGGDDTLIPGGGVRINPPWGLFSRNFRTKIFPQFVGSEQGLIPVKPLSEYKIQLEFDGVNQGDIVWSIAIFDSNKEFIDTVRLMDVVLGGYQQRAFGWRFQTDANTHWFSPVFSFNGPLELNLAAMKVFRIENRQSIPLP